MDRPRRLPCRLARTAAHYGARQTARRHHPENELTAEPTTVASLDEVVGDPDRLRRMKAVATGLLVAVALVYLLTFAMPDNGLTGFVRAAAEAGMVGGLADWFAVTALFRHPLRIPIPHTALIPHRKDQIAGSLGLFITDEFLTWDNLAPYLTQADLVRKAAAEISTPDRAARYAGEAASLAHDFLGALRDTELADITLEVAQRYLDGRSIAPAVGAMVDQAIAHEAHTPLVDVLLEKSRLALRLHRDDVVAPFLKRAISERGALATLWVSDKKVRGLVDGFALVLDAAAHDRGHPLRRVIDTFVTNLAHGLQNDHAVAKRLDEAARTWAADPRAHAWLTGVIGDARTSLRGTLKDAETNLASPIRTRVSGAIAQLGQRIETDDEFRRRLEGWLEQGAEYVVRRYADKVPAFVQHTVAGWSGEAAASKIEIAVGSDLQYIRINGTIVGALAGVVIHAVALLLG